MSESKYTPELVEEICARLCDGEPLAQICRDPHMPNVRTVYEWCSGKCPTIPLTVKEDISIAREIGFDTIAANTMTIARGGYGSTHDVQRDKLIVWNDMQLLSKWSKRYRETKQLTGGDEDDNPIKMKLIEAATKKLDETSTETLLALAEVMDAEQE